jgi:hypothetical protein
MVQGPAQRFQQLVAEAPRVVSRNVLRRFLKEGLGPGFAEFFPHTPIEKLLTPVAWISCAISLLSSECLLLGSHEFAVLVPSQPDV